MFKIEKKDKNPYTLIFYKIKNKKAFFENLLDLILSIHNHVKFLKEYSTIKKEKLKLMQQVQKNLKEIDFLLVRLKETLPLKEDDLNKLKIVQELEKKEKEQEKLLESQKEEEIKTKEEIENLENMKDELKELENKLLQFLLED